MKLTRNRVIAAGVVVIAATFLLTRGKEPQVSRLQESPVCTDSFCEKSDDSSNVPRIAKKLAVQRHTTETRPQEVNPETKSRSKIAKVGIGSIEQPIPPDVLRMFKVKRGPLSTDEKIIMGLYCKCDESLETKKAEEELLTKLVGDNGSAVQKINIYIRILSNFEGNECSCNYMQIQGKLFDKVLSLLDTMPAIEAANILLDIRASQDVFPGLNSIMDSHLETLLIKIRTNARSYYQADIESLVDQLDALSEQTGDNKFRDYTVLLR
ncbi:MAG: hypothetical protein Q7S22_03960 [Candidatus Micrarchaeota archaeon]|nr:hypothetical protein [Candidatus Micrarchaeota archaeon]